MIFGLITGYASELLVSEPVLFAARFLYRDSISKMGIVEKHDNTNFLEALFYYQIARQLYAKPVSSERGGLVDKLCEI